MTDCEKQYFSPHNTDEEERRHHQTAPMKAFSPSVLVTAPMPTPPLTATGATTGATPMLRHNGGEEIQKSPVLAFTRTHAAGVSSSNRNSRTQSPTSASSFAGIAADNVLAVGSSSNNNNTTNGGGTVDVNSNGLASAESNNHALNSSSSQCLEEYVAMHNVEGRSKQLKPLTVSKSPRGKQ